MEKANRAFVIIGHHSDNVEQVRNKTDNRRSGGGGILFYILKLMQLLNWFHNNHTNYTLLSNCLAPSKVIEAVKKYKPKHLYISLDGNKETYKTLRGRDGYDKVIQVVESCKDFVPISFMFCLTPWNTFEDMDYVIQLAKHYNIDVRIGIYNTMDFFDTTEDLMEVGNDYIKKIPQSIHKTQENF